jgi:hypothetical protein
MKTHKHNRSALQWSEKLKLKHIHRTLELAGIVQAQLYDIFQAISTGDFDTVKALVEDGDLFDPCNRYMLCFDFIH